ncbi:glycoside hydrolase family 88 protein [Oleiharenicola lentus]|uniref:glycoside hydrolase family 88 protein n=1 Tax=Oleiharenicola lentus TaxID=2508720 RepID=UPI003F67DDDA
MLSRKLVFMVLFGTAAFLSAAEKPLATLVDEQFAFAAKQYTGLIARMSDDPALQPRNFVNGKVTMSNLEWWTSGFFPGALWLVFEHTRDPQMKVAAEKFTARMEPIKNFYGHHDVGFMMYCSYGQGQRLAPNAAYRDILIQSARSLSKRYLPGAGVIKSWDDQAKWPNPVIIDNMMNLELLWYAADQTGEKTFREIAFRHADQTLAHHFRADHSSFHVVDYDPATGRALRKETHQGFADSSAWARGQAWGLYGFTDMYYLSKEPRYLEQACKIADFIANHPRLPADGIPYWDFDATNIPDALRDASAGAIISSALFRLSSLVTGERAQRYRALAEKQLRALSSHAYRAGLDENGNFLLMHSVGNMPIKSEIDVPIVYADYYFLEALARAY